MSDIIWLVSYAKQTHSEYVRKNLSFEHLQIENEIHEVSHVRITGFMLYSTSHLSSTKINAYKIHSQSTVFKHRSHGQDRRSGVVHDCISVTIGDYPDSIGNLS